jgi:hypothetical protein
LATTVFRHRYFYEWRAYFAAAFVLAAAGFWPSFFANLPNTDWPHLLHGTSATLWMLLPIGQAWLIKSRKRRLHRIFGYAMLPLAGAVVLTAINIIHIMLRKNTTGFDPMRAEFAFLDLTGLVLFLTFLALGIRAARHRDIGLHLRLMACTALIPLEAAIERLFANLAPKFVPDSETALAAALWTMIGILVVLTAAETLQRRMRWPFPTLLAYYLLMHAAVGSLAAMTWFRQLATWLGSA